MYKYVNQMANEYRPSNEQELDDMLQRKLEASSEEEPETFHCGICKRDTWDVTKHLAHWTHKLNEAAFKQQYNAYMRSYKKRHNHGFHVFWKAKRGHKIRLLARLYNFG